MKSLLLAMAVLALGVALAGCGSKKSASSTTTGAAAPVTTSAAAGAFSSSGGCRHLVQLGVKVSQAITASGSNTSSKSVAQAYDRLASGAPAAIRGDLKTLAGALKTYAAALAKTRAKRGTTQTAAQVATLQNAAKSLTDPKMQAAEQHLTTWVTTHCSSG
jgi:hypothetical protein